MANNSKGTKTKKTNTKASASGVKKPAVKKLPPPPEHKKSKPLGIAPYVIAAFAVFIIITYFIADSGFLGRYIKLVLWGLFGAGAFFIPFYMLFISFFWKRDHENKVTFTKYMLATVNFVFVLAIIHLLYPAPAAPESTSLGAHLYECGKRLTDAGVIGGMLGIGLQSLIGYVASLILSFFMAAVTIIFFFGSTPSRVIKAIIRLFSRVKLPSYDDMDEASPEPEIQKPAPEPAVPKRARQSRVEMLNETPEHRAGGREEIKEQLREKPSADTTRGSEPKDRYFNDGEVAANPPSRPPIEEPVVLDGESPFMHTDPNGQRRMEPPTVPAEAVAAAVVAGVEADRNKHSLEEINGDYKRIFEETQADAKLPALKNNAIDADEAELGAENPAAASPVISKEFEPLTERSFDDQREHDAVQTDEGFLTISEPVTESTEPPYIFPPISLLNEDESSDEEIDYSSIVATGKKLVSVLESYGVKTKLVSTSRGPSVTRYELQPDAGVRVSKISNLSDDIRMRLAATNIRIETNIPGKSAVGIEIPNEKAGTVRLRNLISNRIFTENKSKLFVCLGVDVGGNPVYFDIPDMPHLLIAGATGMGKSVCINSVIISLLYRATPDELKLILIDPKKIELSSYNDIPHLHIPVVHEPRKAAGALNWAVVEMEKRYTLMTEVGDARNLKEYNDMIDGDPERQKLPYIVIVIDELADLIMSAPDDVETSICRLAQKARAAGIYLIIGTQRPSVDVITGLIKANIPSRIAFTVSSNVDSRTILDMAGAEKLLGRGDMLFAPVKALKPIRVQGAFVDGKTEVSAVCNFVKNAAKVSYSDDAIRLIEEEARLCGMKPSERIKEANAGGGDKDKEDPLFLDAIGVGLEFQTMSSSLLQRRLAIGYSRAQKIVDLMEDRGYVGKFDPSTKKRTIVITLEEYQQLKLNKEDTDE